MGWFDRWRKRKVTTESGQGQLVQTRAKGSFLRMGGRRYMAEAPYLLPKDDAEINRLDFQHFFLRYMMKGNFVAPISQPLEILDVGCGTGRWAMEMAVQFPRANVVGTDLVAPPAENTANLGPDLAKRPDNFMFVPGNVLEGLPFPDASFDFVHMRLLFLAIPTTRWDDVVRELVRVTRPGGWIELLEGSRMENRGPASQANYEWLVEALRRRGIDPMDGTRVGDRLRAAGMTNVTLRELPVPVGQHGGRVGVMMQTDIFAAFRSVGGLVAALGVTDQATFNRNLEVMEKEVEQTKGYFPFYLAYGQRPAVR